MKDQCSLSNQCQAATVCLRLEELKKEYDAIVSTTEMRDDLDFYYTILHLCKQHGLNPYTGQAAKGTDPEKIKENDPAIKEIRSYISENNPRHQRFHVAFLTASHFALYSAPVIIFFVGIITNLLPHF